MLIIDKNVNVVVAADTIVVLIVLEVALRKTLELRRVRSERQPGPIRYKSMMGSMSGQLAKVWTQN